MCQNANGMTPNPPLNSKALSQRGALVFNMLNMNAQDIMNLEQALTRQRSAAYKTEYNRLLKQAGVRLQRVLVLDRATLDNLAARSQSEAETIAQTYDRDLARQIEAIELENPKISRDDLVKRLQSWHTARANWKGPQISLWANRDAVQQAQTDFFKVNGQAIKAKAKVFPRSYVCDDCGRLVGMGEVDIQVALANPCPRHPNCVHQWVTSGMERVGPLPQGQFWSGLLQRVGLR